jgi:hypothetical protein
MPMDEYEVFMETHENEDVRILIEELKQSCTD